MNHNFLKNLTYTGADGKRRPRNFVLAATLIVLVLIAIGGAGVWFSASSRVQINATPRPIAGPAFTPTTGLAAREPNSKAAASSCPTDSAQWNLIDVFPNNNYKRIDPACVYEGLARPIAWILAAQGAGHTNPEAIQKLGYLKDFPYDNSLEKIDLLPAQGNKPVALTTAWSPLQKDYRDWFVVNDAVESERITLTGCYRTYGFVGNLTEFWSPQWAASGATVICEIAQDRLAGWDVSALDGVVYSTYSSSATRSLAYLIYDNRPEYRSWYFVGGGNEFRMTVAELERTRSKLKKSYNSPVWDLTWLEKTYGLSPVPLPQDWQQHTSQDDFNKILAILNR